MQALLTLTREHAAIGALLARFEIEIASAIRSGELDGEAVERLLAFFEREVDGHHQEKEERVLLPRLLARARGVDLATLRSLADEHALQRKLLTRMRNQIEGASYGEPNSVAVLVRLAKSYVQHQREHSRWEQNVLFPLARRTLGPADDRALRIGFRRLDEVWGAPLWDAACELAEWLDQRRSLVPA
jgi:hemerythrin-like domain-containing protein